MHPILFAAAARAQSILDNPQLSTAPLIPVFIVFAIVAIAWFFFPIFIWAQLRQTNKLLREIRDTAERTADNTRPPGASKASSGSVKYSV